ncbi:MAG: RNA methyltransferase [Pseudomonadales bacterium]|nr:RNA methyltransferase [Pseudomonadales bacterium]
MLERVRIVLVETSHPGNIGACARAMKTMGLADLVLVNPGRFPDPQAWWRAAGGDDVLGAARIVDSLDAALEDCHWVVATSARQRRIPWPVLSPHQFADAGMQRIGQRIAVVFGREDKGLFNDELQRCHAHIEIPANTEYPVLNVAMAVQVIAYELFQRASGGPPTLVWDRPAATVQMFEAFMAHLESVVTGSGFVDADHPGQTLTRFRRLFTRLELDVTEVAMLRGLLNKLER